MRKKTIRSNHRKFKPGKIFAFRRRDEEGDWFLVESTASPVRLPERTRTKRRSFLVKALALACLGVSIPLVANWGYEEVFYQNEEFLLHSLNIRTDGVLSEARLSEIANVSAGMNLMELDLGAIQSQIEKLPQVEKASVTREMPDRLNVIVRERMATAWLSCPPLGIRPWDMERGFLMDENGVLFRCLDLNDGMKLLPVVETFKIAEPGEGSKIESAGILASLKLIIESDKRFLEHGIAVEEIKVRDEWAIECHFQNDLVVTFGIFDYERGLDDLALILDRMANSPETLATVNVAAERNIPVTFAKAPVLPDPEQLGPGTSLSNDPAHNSVPGESEESPEKDQEKHLRSILKGG